MDEIVLPSFAKINLILRVTGKRRDGFHTLETVFQTVDLQDTLTFRFEPSRHFHLILDAGDSDIPPDSSNLIYKASHLFQEAHPKPVRMEVTIEKRIPLQAGLGGGSSNAAVTLIALSRYFGWPLKHAELIVLSRKLGSDVPFFLVGGTAFGLGRGDRVKKMPDWPSPDLLLVHSSLPCSTPAIYRAFDEAGLLTQKRDSIKIHFDQRPESLRDLVSLIENDLEKVVFALYPELDSIKKQIVESGAAAASLTGSGSTLFGIYDSGRDLEQAAKKFPYCTPARFVGRTEYVAQVFGDDR
jgi:4-diphosphocytidyl-2-C-methyl-D-erythritol kinase